MQLILLLMNFTCADGLFPLYMRLTLRGFRIHVLLLFAAMAEGALTPEEQRDALYMIVNVVQLDDPSLPSCITDR